MSLDRIIRNHEALTKAPVMLSFPHNGKIESGLLINRFMTDGIVTGYLVKSHNLPFVQRVPADKVSITNKIR